MHDESIRRIAQLLHERSAILDIELEPSAIAAGIDDSFRSGPLQGRTVNIEWYLKREGLQDTSEFVRLDYYLVLAGPLSAAASSRGSTRPWCIEAVFLFDARQLRAEQVERGVKRKVASSMVKRQREAAEIFPAPSNPIVATSPRQAEMFELFRG